MNLKEVYTRFHLPLVIFRYLVHLTEVATCSKLLKLALHVANVYVHHNIGENNEHNHEMYQYLFKFHELNLSNVFVQCVIGLLF